jgi:hypothetical protein
MTTTSRQDNNRVTRSAGRRLPLRYQDFHLANMAHTLQNPIGACIELPSLARAYAALNLSSNGQPLTYARAKAGSDALHWFRAEDEELRRLIESATIRPIAASAQPIDRRRDTTYYNPQTKEKQAADGSKTFRIRSTAGDRPHQLPWRRLSSHRRDDGGSQSER